MGMKKWKVCHKRNDCIGCGSCALLASRFWKMSEQDGKSILKGARWKGKEFMVAEIDEDEVEENQRAAEACPVRIIRVEGPSQ